MILFTEIHSPLSALPSELVPPGMRSIADRCPSLINRYGPGLFMDLLYRRFGVRSYTGYAIEEHSYIKTYGYFVVTDDMLTTFKEHRCIYP